MKKQRDPEAVRLGTRGGLKNLEKYGKIGLIARFKAGKKRKKGAGDKPPCFPKR